MEFLDINLTKDSSLLLYASRSLFYWELLKKTILYSGFKNQYKLIRKTRNSSLFMNKHFVEPKNEGRKPDKTRVEKTLVLAQKPRLKIPFKNSMSGKGFVSYSVGLYGSNRTLLSIRYCMYSNSHILQRLNCNVCARQSSSIVHFFGPSLPPPPPSPQ
jgi:hypothetical protein